MSTYVGRAAEATDPAGAIWTAPLDITTWFVYAVALLLLASFIVAVIVVIKKRPQKTAMVLVLATIPLYLVYYDDRFRAIPGLGAFKARSWAGPIAEGQEKADPNFHSDIAPAIMLGVILLFHLIVIQRLAARERLQRIANLTSTFFAGSSAATMLGGTIVSTFHLGWIGAVAIGGAFALLYLGAIFLLLAIVELTVELSKLAAAWIKRKIFAIATHITRAANFIAALGGRLVSRNLIEQIRAATAAQEGTFIREQDEQDRRLIEAYIHDLDRKRQARLKALRAKYGDDDSIADLRAYVEPPAAGAPAEPAPAAASDYTPPPARDPFEPTQPMATTPGAEPEPTTRG